MNELASIALVLSWVAIIALNFRLSHLRTMIRKAMPKKAISKDCWNDRHGELCDEFDCLCWCHEEKIQ